jgi:uncharacterized phage infection (PIP) family protein YhgE
VVVSTVFISATFFVVEIFNTMHTMQERCDSLEREIHTLSNTNVRINKMDERLNNINSSISSEISSATSNVAYLQVQTAEIYECLDILNAAIVGLKENGGKVLRQQMQISDLYESVSVMRDRIMPLKIQVGVINNSIEQLHKIIADNEDLSSKQFAKTCECFGIMDLRVKKMEKPNRKEMTEYQL